MNAHERRPAAVLWDMDGTLVDSEPYWIAAETELCAAHGVEWTEGDGLALVGSALTYSAGVLRERGVKLSTSEIIDILVTQVANNVRTNVPWQPDARALLNRLFDAGTRCALVTMSYRPLAGAFTEHEPRFEVVVTGEEVAKGKPDPESYLLAASRLGVDIADCLAIEDSPSGTQAAHASGARTVAIERLVKLDPLPGMSMLASLDSLTDDAIARIMSGEVVDELPAVAAGDGQN